MRFALVANFTARRVASGNPARVLDAGRCNNGAVSVTATAVSPNGHRVYASSTLDNSASVIDTNPASATYNTVIAVIPVGDGPNGMEVSPDGTHLSSRIRAVRACRWSVGTGRFWASSVVPTGSQRIPAGTLVDTAHA